jgi:hypothetical protein
LIRIADAGNDHMMMSWFRSHPQPPPRDPGNPGKGHELQMAFANGERSWTESSDLLASLAKVLAALGYKHHVRRHWLELESGFLLVPGVVEVVPQEKPGVRTVSTIQVSHPKLLPEGVFEYQHAWGDDSPGSFTNGLKAWAEADLPVFLDSMLEDPKQGQCMFLLPAAGRPSFLPPQRRVILGPTTHFAKQPAPEGEEHCFCPCCLFTNSFGAFTELIKRDEFFGIRLFAWRSEDGKTIEADCRVNGVDYPAGVEGLVRYVKTWPDRGIEFRKQYVGVQSFP